MNGPAHRKPDTATIHVALLDEGVEVWRPVEARRLTADTYLILGQDYDRSVETWAFAPGTVVRCRRELRDGRSILVAIDPADDAVMDDLEALQDTEDWHP
jgi:hypothetical protein